jgi:hypothetical protein
MPMTDADAGIDGAKFVRHAVVVEASAVASTATTFVAISPR